MECHEVGSPPCRRARHHARPGADPGDRRPHRPARPRRLVRVRCRSSTPALDVRPVRRVLPVLFGVVWWVTVRAGDRFWTLVAGVVLAVLLAQAAACLVMTWDLGVAAWAAGYVTAKAVPAALIVARVHALVRRHESMRVRHERRGDLDSGSAVRGRRAARRRPVVDRRRSTHPACRPRDRTAASCPSSSRCCSSRARPRCACAGCARACRACSADGSRRSSRAESWASSRRSSVVVVDGIQSDIWPLMADVHRRRRRPVVRRLRRMGRRRERGRGRPGALDVAAHACCSSPPGSSRSSR